jgi:enoyl-CoA hydratase/carnithine racemase
MLDRHVRYRADNGIAWATLDRPEVMNALTEEVFDDLFDVVRFANDDSEVRALIMTGSGPHFCSGGDLSWEQGLDEAKSARLMRLNAHLSFEMRHAAQPIIGAVRGWCLGGGNELQLHFDVTIASDTSRFGWPETRWGLLPFWYTPQLLPLVVGERVAREMLLFGRSYTAEQALEVGLVNAVVPDSELEVEAQHWAEELLRRSPSAIRLVKQGLNGLGDMLRVAANHEGGIVSKAVTSESYHDDVSAFFDTDQAERRPLPARPRLRSQP